MKVYNKEKTTILENYDLEKGHLVQDILTTHTLEQAEVQEKSHYVVVKEYENGGKDVEEIIDQPYIPFVPAHDKEEQILVYLPYTQEELLKIEEDKLNETYSNEIADLEQWFNYYDLQIKQYTRATRLGETFDKDINLLDNEAKEKAKRIKELRTKHGQRTSC